MSDCNSQGAITRLSINGYQMPFRLIDDQSFRELVDDSDEVITGHKDPIKERVSLGLLYLTLRVRLQPTPLELAQLLPLMGMSNSSGNNWVLDESLASFPIVIDRVAKVHTYSTCYVNRWTLMGQKGRSAVSLDLEIFGTSLAEGTSFGSPTAIQTDAPYPFTGLTLTLRGSARACDRVAFSVNHFLEREFENSLTASCIDMTRRRATLATSVPYKTANADLLTTALLTNADGAAAEVAFARGGQSTTISLNNIKEIARPPGIPGKIGLRLNWFGRIYRDLTNKAFSAVHDSTV